VTPRPFALLAELTHRCPLRCPYCSNGLELSRKSSELSTADWSRVLREAAAMGVLHVFFSGGEPLLRPDLGDLTRVARQVGLYSNLITSAYGLTRDRLAKLQAEGLDSVQVSLQAAEPGLADAIAGAEAHARKLAAAALVRELGLPLTINVVLHRENLHQLEALIGLAERLGAQRLELANVQFYGWAFANREVLLPTIEQVRAAETIAAAARERLKGRMEVLYVLPDYHGDRPKPCMQGWGARQLTVDPEGRVLPCPTAGAIPGMRFDSVRDRPLSWIWAESEAFNRFRGTDWMPEPCRSCDQRTVDHGGCRCQAALLTGDPARTDPACGLSPDREALTQLVRLAGEHQRSDRLFDLRYRVNPVA
jgi:pyrroloquinoline quinone biosynthesis protein E